MNQKQESEFDKIFWEHKDLVFFTAKKYFKRIQDAEDIVQEVFLKVYLHFHSFLKKSSLKTWIYRITLNEIYNRFRKEKKHAENFALSESLEYTKPIDSIEIFYQKELLQSFYQALQQMPKKRGKVLFYRLTQNLSFKEIGEILDISEDSAKNLFSIGLKKLKKKLEAHHGTTKMGPPTPKNQKKGQKKNTDAQDHRDWHDSDSPHHRNKSIPLRP